MEYRIVFFLVFLRKQIFVECILGNYVFIYCIKIYSILRIRLVIYFEIYIFIIFKIEIKFCGVQSVQMFLELRGYYIGYGSVFKGLFVKGYFNKERNCI